MNTLGLITGGLSESATLGTLDVTTVGYATVTGHIKHTRGEVAPWVLSLEDEDGDPVQLTAGDRVRASLAADETATALATWDTNTVGSAISIEYVGSSTEPARIVITPTLAQSLLITEGAWLLQVWYTHAGSTIAIKPAVRVIAREGAGELSA